MPPRYARTCRFFYERQIYVTITSQGSMIQVHPSVVIVTFTSRCECPFGRNYSITAQCCSIPGSGSEKKSLSELCNSEPVNSKNRRRISFPVIHIQKYIQVKAAILSHHRGLPTHPTPPPPLHRILPPARSVTAVVMSALHSDLQPPTHNCWTHRPRLALYA